MEVKVGVINVSREIVFESSQKPEEIQKIVRDALGNDQMLSLVDEKGRVICVPVDKLAYVEIGEPLERRVGFGALS